MTGPPRVTFSDPTLGLWPDSAVASYYLGETYRDHRGGKNGELVKEPARDFRIWRELP